MCSRDSGAGSRSGRLASSGRCGVPMLNTDGAASQAAARALRAAPRVVVATGAGISQDSGIPTFRDAGVGLWARYDPEELATEAAFRRHPARVFGWYAWRRRLVRAALPHAGYHALVALEGLVPELAIVTQNVDGLHTRAGSRRVLELHGSLERFSCLDARHPFPADRAPEPAADTECEPPRCERCGSPVRPDVVWFGEMLPERVTAEVWALAASRRAADAAGVPVAILVDLQGPRIRVGELAQPRVLRAGEKVVFAPEDVARGDELPTTYQDLAKDARAGARVLLDDGLLSVDVTRIAEPRVEGRVVDGGTLTSHKGMNLPGLHVSAPALTDKDREDVGHAVGWGVDYVALSFVRRADDLAELRRLVPPGIKLVAKIEKAAALEDLDGILRASDAVMVARGDLGVELPFEEVPVVQKRLIREANRHGKPVITATQMLESMVHHPRPTRAEASDVANAILDGTDAVMLSAETAVGEYPLEAVRAMDRIIREMERHPLAVARDERRVPPGQDVALEDAIAVGTSAVARMLKTPLIVTLTKGGFTARKVAALRPPIPILAVTTEAPTYRQLALVWGVTAVLVDHVPSYDAMLEVVPDLLLKRGYARAGDRIVMTAGVPWEVSGATNLLKVEVV